MRIAYDFDPSDPDESELFAFDFGPDLDPQETISNVTWKISVTSGTDANATSRLDGDPAINNGVVSQRVTGLQSGVRYELRAIATTSKNNRLSLWSEVNTNVA